MDVLVPLPFAVPLLVAALLIGLQSHLPHWLNDLIAVATAATVCGICCVLLFMSTKRPLVYWFGGWVPHQDVAIGVSFAVAPLGAGLASMYHGLMLIFLAAMSAFCLTADLFNLLVWFELMSATAYALTAYRIEEKGPLQGALNFAIVNTIGGYLIFSGLGLIYARTGALNFAQIGRAVSSQPADSLVVVAFVLMATGFLVKASVVPFHFWLADAHAVAPTPVCVLFSGVMVELGVYAVARIY